MSADAWVRKVGLRRSRAAARDTTESRPVFSMAQLIPPAGETRWWVSTPQWSGDFPDGSASGGLLMGRGEPWRSACTARGASVNLGEREPGPGGVG